MKLIPGGPGAKSGRVFVGDKLKMINDIDITQISIDDFPELISGPMGSAVKLTLIRKHEGGGDTIVHATLTRGPCESANGSGPRVLVPKVIAVNPVHLIHPDHSSVAQPNSSKTYAKGGSDENQGLVAASVTKPSPPKSIGVNPGLFRSERYTQDETPRMTSNTSGTDLRALKPYSADSYSHDSGHPTQRTIPLQPSSYTPAIYNTNTSNAGSAAMSSSASKRIGVGIIFSNEDRRGLQVKRLAEGGPAHASGAIYPGDTLVEINGRNVIGSTVSDIQEEIVGPWNSRVTLGFRRHHPGSADSLHRVQLARIWDPPQDSDLPSRQQVRVPIDVFVRPSKIMEMLFLGDDSVSRNRECLRSEGITCIINAAKECPCHFEREFAYTHMQFEDSSVENIRKGFDQVSAIISRNMMQGLSTLVHCSSGLSRSAALCIAFLMKEKKATLRQSFHLVKRAKPSISLKYGFYLQLVDYERDLFGFNTMNAITQDEYFQMMLGAS